MPKAKNSGSNNYSKGLIVNEILPHLKVNFHAKDLLQVIIGASILAIPVGFTEETWNLGLTLPLTNILILMFISLLFIALFTHYHYHKHTKGKHLNKFLKRVLITYIVAFMIVAMLLSLIQKAPWTTDLLIAFKRTVIVTFPASMSAAIADTIK